MSFESGEGMGKLLCSALHGEALVINKNEFKIVAVLIDKMGNKNLELEVETSSYYGYKSHVVIGEDQDIAACLRMDGFLSLQKLDFKFRLFRLRPARKESFSFLFSELNC